MNDLKPWYANATPHEEIHEGRLNESVFAANLCGRWFGEGRWCPLNIRPIGRQEYGIRRSTEADT